MSLSAGIFFKAAAITHGYMLGDADDDLEITMKDILLVRKYVAGVLDDILLNTLAADTDNDSDITLKDVLVIRKVVAGVCELDGNNTDGLYRVDSVSVANRNLVRYSVVIPDDADKCMKYSSRELVKYINKECGTTLNVVEKSSFKGGNKIEYIYDKDDEFALGKEGYRVVVDESCDMNIYCGSMRGPLYATYFVLEELGWRFIPVGTQFSSNDGIYLYKAENVNIGVGFDETEVPAFEYRSVAQGGCTPSNFAMLRANAVDGEGSRNCTSEEYGWGVGTLYIHAHSYADQMAGYEHIYDWSAIEPYSRTQPCLIKEETYEKVVDYNLKLLDERKSWGQYLGKHYTQISCSPNDNTDFCQCSGCKEIYEIEGSIAGTVFRLSNRVIERLRIDYPGIELYTIAYWDARNPPKYTRPDDDICVCFCISGCNNHAYDDTASCVACGGNPRLKSSSSGENLSNAEDIDFFEKWAELTNNLYVWYYSSNFHYYLAPSPNIFNIYNDFRTVAQIGAIGVYSEGSTTPYYSFEYLRAYLVSKMMWDPYMSEEEFNNHINEYLMIWYGDAWENIREYLEMSNYAADLKGCWVNNFDRPYEMYSEEYYRDNYERMDSIFEDALSKAKNQKEIMHIETLRCSCDFLGLSAVWSRDYDNGDEQSKAICKQRYERFYDTVEKYDIQVTSWGGPTRGCENLPESKNDIYSPMRWIFDDFTGYWD